MTDPGWLYELFRDAMWERWPMLFGAMLEALHKQPLLWIPVALVVVALGTKGFKALAKRVGLDFFRSQ